MFLIILCDFFKSKYLEKSGKKIVSVNKVLWSFKFDIN